MARDAYEKAHDAAEAYMSAYTEMKDYTGTEVRKGHRVNTALDELKQQVDLAVAQRDAEAPADDSEQEEATPPSEETPPAEETPEETPPTGETTVEGGEEA